ncbi:hypothetical protein FWH58_00115 [Candidatus Saccharibacteria bacterium]|nr:hypothetical protein [Candidatus Saccharibacteria bacterium]
MGRGTRIGTEQPAKQVINESDFRDLVLPDKYEQGLVKYVSTVLQLYGGLQLSSQEGFVEMWRDQYLKSLNGYCGKNKLRAMPILVPLQSLEKNIAVSDQFGLYGVEQTGITPSFYVNSDIDNPLKPEFNSIMGEIYDESDIKFALALVLMKGKFEFEDMIHRTVPADWQRVSYDGLDSNLQEITYSVKYGLEHDRNRDKHVVDDMRSLPEGQRPMDPQTGFAFHGMRRAMRAAGSTASGIGGDSYVLTPIDVNTNNNGRIENLGGNWLVPAIKTEHYKKRIKKQRGLSGLVLEVVSLGTWEPEYEDQSYERLSLVGDAGDDPRSGRWPSFGRQYDWMAIDTLKSSGHKTVLSLELDS